MLNKDDMDAAKGATYSTISKETQAAENSVCDNRPEYLQELARSRGIIRCQLRYRCWRNLGCSRAVGQLARLTLLRIVARLEHADSGEVFLGGRRAIHAGPPHALDGGCLSGPHIPQLAIASVSRTTGVRIKAARPVIYLPRPND